MDEHIRDKLCLVALLVLTLIMNPSAAQQVKKSQRNTTDAGALIDKLLDRSDSRVRPTIYGPAVKVNCDFFVQSLGPMNEVEMEYQLEIYFRQRWVDERFTFDDQEEPVYIPAKSIDHIWVPDLYFTNEKEASVHQVTVPNKAIMIYPNGTVWYSSRLSLRLTCNMHLMHYPLDYQDCLIKISSYTYDKTQVLMEWLDDKPVEYDLRQMSLPQFDLLGVEADKCMQTFKTGTFSCLVAIFHLKRLVGFYVLQTYVPSILIVSLSWVSFWISKDAVPARITLGVTTVLTMTTQLSTSRSNTMRVSYPKAMDVWYAMCMLYVFAALLEYAVVNVLSRRPQRRHNPKKRDSEAPLNVLPERACAAEENKEDQLIAMEVDDSGTAARRRNRRRCQWTFAMHSPAASAVDKGSRVAFPLTFVLFNFIYWVVYTQPVVFNYMFQSLDITKGAT